MERFIGGSSIPTLAIVVPCFNEDESLPRTIAKLLECLKDMQENFLVSQGSFLFFVDDGSSDDTWVQIQDAHKSFSCVQGVKLSRNFGHQNALMAGLMSVKERTDISISIDADLQQDPAALKLFVKQFLAGADIVFGVRRDRSSDTGFKKFSALAFYRLMTSMGVNVVPNHADYRLLSQRAMRVLEEFIEPNIFLRAICSNLGFKTAKVVFDVVDREAGESKYSLFKMLKFALDGIVSFSVAPLRLIAVVGFVIFLLSAFMGIYVVTHTLIFKDTVPGWASTTLPMYFLGGIQLLSLSVIGEYIAQIAGGVKKRPRYIVESELI